MRAGRGSGGGGGGARGGKTRRGSAPGGGADPFANRGFYYWFDLLDAEHRAKLQAFRSRLEAASVLAKPMVRLQKRAERVTRRSDLLPGGGQEADADDLGADMRGRRDCRTAT